MPLFLWWYPSLSNQLISPSLVIHGPNLFIDIGSTDKEDSNFDYHTTNLSSLTFISCGEINCLWEIQFPFSNRTQKATHPSEVNFIHPPPTTASISSINRSQCGHGEIVGICTNDAIKPGDERFLDVL